MIQKKTIFIEYVTLKTLRFYNMSLDRPFLRRRITTAVLTIKTYKTLYYAYIFVCIKFNISCGFSNISLMYILHTLHTYIRYFFSKTAHHYKILKFECIILFTHFIIASEQASFKTPSNIINNKSW